jgi:transposase InsO family protein
MSALALNDLEHRRTKVKHPYTTGFVERFQLTIKEEFFGVTLRVTVRETLYDSVEALQAALDAWLAYYNTERPHLGYRHQGRRPIDTISLFTQPVRHEGL